jgi:DNA-binding NtrC family response regulator
MSSERVMQFDGAAHRSALANPALSAAPFSGQAIQGSPTVFMVGNSPAMLEVFDQVRRFAACDVPVLITGESGTGKELVARAIHERSGRAGRPYVALNCAAVPASLIASELFGYEKGSFTGATARRHGHIEHAHRGTLFLDEIGDMPIDLQGLLLRFLQEGEILRVGGRQPIKVDVRVVAATNVRLHEAIVAGRLREDLYYRLNVLTLQLPALCERDGDVEVLAIYFLRQIAHELGRELRGFKPAALAALLAYPWPGNVRQLIATIRRAAVLANGPLIEVADLRLDAHRPAPPTRPAAAAPHPRPRGAPRPKPGSDGERDAILQALRESRFNVTRAAQLLGVARATLYRMLQRNRIELGQHYLVQPTEPEAEAEPSEHGAAAAR